MDSWIADSRLLAHELGFVGKAFGDTVQCREKKSDILHCREVFSVSYGKMDLNFLTEIQIHHFYEHFSKMFTFSLKSSKPPWT